MQWSRPLPNLLKHVSALLDLNPPIQAWSLTASWICHHDPLSKISETCWFVFKGPNATLGRKKKRGREGPPCQDPFPPGRVQDGRASQLIQTFFLSHLGLRHSNAD